jgi:dephospho-CoA kinase
VKADTHAITLTGGIATGKSSAGKIFSGYGFEIIDADSIAHQMLDLQAEKIAELFGAAYLLEGKVDRKALGSLVFGEEKKRKALEALLHPLIREEIIWQAKQLDTVGKPYLVDLPLFFESGQYPFPEVIVVYSPRERQLARLIERNGYSVEEAESRLAAQIDIEEKRAKADYLIDNSGDRDQLERECQRVRDLILAKNKL